LIERPTHTLLDDIKSAAQDAMDFCANLDGAELATLQQTDHRTFRAIKNALAEIGEAVKRLPPGIAAKHPQVDWRGWAGLRDIVAHQYFALELPRLQTTIAEELPTLLAVVEKELACARP
jgi:uncharacterized protein with HEPN domain